MPRKQIEVRGYDDETVDALQSDWYRETVGLITPGNVIRVYRKNRGMTQAELGRRLGGNGASADRCDREGAARGECGDGETDRRCAGHQCRANTGSPRGMVGISIGRVFSF